MTDFRDKLADICDAEIQSDNPSCYVLADAIIDALPSLVKPLEWKDFAGYGAKASAWRCANYMITRWSDGSFDLVESYPGYEGEDIAASRYPTLEAAKAAAQADYTRRILAAFGVTKDE